LSTRRRTLMTVSSLKVRLIRNMMAVYEQYFLLVAALLLQGHVHCNIDNIMDDIIDIDGCDASSGPVQSLLNEDGLSPVKVMKTLNQKGISAYRLFKVSRKAHIKSRANLPIVKRWMEKKINLDVQEKNPEIVYRLLGRCSDLLQVSRVGCEGHACEKPVIAIQSKYQYMVYKASKISYKGMLTILKLFKRFMRRSIRYPKHQYRYLNLSLPYIRALSEQYQVLSNLADDLQKEAVTAMVNAVGMTWKAIQRFKKMKGESDKVSIALKTQHARIEELTKTMNSERLKIDAAEKEKVVFLKQFMKLLNTDVVDTTECDSKVIKQYKKVTNAVKDYILYNRRQNYRTRTTYRTTYQRISDKIERKCWQKKDVVHLQSLQSKIKSIKKLLNDSVPIYRLLLQQFADTQREKVEIVGQVSQGMRRMKLFSKMKSEHERALDSIDLMVRSLTLVKIILMEAREFWEDQANLIQENVKLVQSMKKKDGEKSFDDEDIISRLVGIGKAERDRDMLTKIGFQWLLFGKLCVDGYEMMEVVKEKVNDDFLKVLTPKDEQRIIRMGQKTIVDIQKLHEKLKVKDVKQQTEINNVLDSCKGEM